MQGLGESHPGDWTCDPRYRLLEGEETLETGRHVTPGTGFWMSHSGTVDSRECLQGVHLGACVCVTPGTGVWDWGHHDSMSMWLQVQDVRYGVTLEIEAT